MAFIKRLRNQNWLFPPTIADLIEEDHICRLVDDVVESIDFKRIEEKYDGPGSPAYHPKVMMKLLIQGTIDGIRSSRKISKAIKENVVYMYLSDRLNPNFRTICRFRKDNLETIKLVIAEIAKLAREMGMIKLGHLSIDGTKIKASASNFSVLSKEEFDEIKEAIDLELQKGIEIDEMKNTIISTDNDYHSAENIDFLKEHELDGYIPHEKLASKMKGGTKEPGRFDKDNFKYNVEKDEFTCPNGETVKFSFEYFDKQNIGLRVFLTRGLQGVMAEFSLACIAHTLKRIWTIKSQTEAIGVNSTKNGRIDQSSLKILCGRIKGVWSQISSSLGKRFKYIPSIVLTKVNCGTFS